MTQQELSSPSPQRCQNYHLVFGLAGEHSCSTGRMLLSHTGGGGERETQEKRQEKGNEKDGEMLTLELLGMKGTRQKRRRDKKCFVGGKTEKLKMERNYAPKKSIGNAFVQLIVSWTWQ